MARDARETVKLVQERVLVGLSSYRARGWRWEANCQSDNCFHWSGTSVEYVPHPATISEGWSHESWKGGGFWCRATGHRVRLTGYIFRHEYILSWLQVGYGQTGIAPLSTRKTSQVLFFSFLPLLSHLRAAMPWLREKLESELKFHLQLWQATSCSNVRELLWKAAIWVSPWLVNVWLDQVKTWRHSPALKIMALTGWVHQPRPHQLCPLHPIASPCASSSASTLRRLHEKVRKSNRPSVQHPENQEKIQMTRSPGRRCGWIQ